MDINRDNKVGTRGENETDIGYDNKVGIRRNDKADTGQYNNRVRDLGKDNKGATKLATKVYIRV